MDVIEVVEVLFAILVSVMTVIGAAVTGVKWLVKHYLAELKPNSGGSMNDRLRRLEDSVATIHRHLLGETA